MCCLSGAVEKLQTERYERWAESDFRFGGLLPEDPVEYVRRVEEYAEINNVQPQKMERFISTTLAESAAAWFRRETTPGIFNWPMFKIKFLNRYGSPKVITDLTRRLYSDNQNEHQIVAAFVEYKIALVNRLMPQMTEIARVNLLIDLLEPDLQAHAVMQDFRDTSEMVDKLMRVEVFRRNGAENQSAGPT